MSNREAILSRLEEVLAGVSGVNHFQRNKAKVHEARLPAIVLLDADESLSSEHVNGRPAAAPAIMEMTPEIYLLVQDDAADVGPAMNALLDDIVAAVRSDTDLLALTHNGDIRYEGCQTALARERSMAGEMGIALSFYYVHR